MAPRLTNGHSQPERLDGRRGSLVPPILFVFGVLGIAWGVHSNWRGDAEQDADRPGEATITAGHLDGPAGSWRKPPLIERSPADSGWRASEPARAETAQQATGLAGSAESGVEFAGKDPVLLALGEADDEMRFRQLEEAVYGGADIPVERMHEVLAMDPSDEVRGLALTALTEYTEASPTEIRAVAEGALGNTSSAIRTQAGQILARMDELESIHRESLGVQPET